MARFRPPPGGATPFDHRPELWAAFNRYYGTLWTDGVVDEPTKEVGRLRNARVTGCGICRNLRFAGARDQGLGEELVDQIRDDHQASALPPRFKLALRLGDGLIGPTPAAVDADLAAELRAALSPAEIVELALTAAIA